MIDRFRIQNITEKDQELLALADWAWNSHWWVEYSPGYCECKWCGAQHTSQMGIASDFPLCKNNPAVKNFIASAFSGSEKAPSKAAGQFHHYGEVAESQTYKALCAGSTTTLI